MEYSIRRATLADAAALAQVHETTWRETYIGLMSEQMLDAHTADARTEAWRRILSGETGYLATTYVAERAQWNRASKYKIRFASLPNILVGAELVPEILGLERRPADVVSTLEAMLADDAIVEAQRAGFRRIRAGMEKGAPEAPLTDPAERVLAHLPAAGAPPGRV